MNERELFERYAERVLQFFVNKVRSEADAADLAQETFVRSFERIKAGDVKHPRAFLFGVAHFVLIEYWKSKARAPEGLDPGSQSVVAMGAAETTMSSKLARGQHHAQVLDAMRHLRLDYQNVLELRYWHDLKYEEIAEILGQNAKTIGVWLRRAKQELGRVLESMPPLSADTPAFSPSALESWLRDSGDVAQSLVKDAAASPDLGDDAAT